MSGQQLTLSAEAQAVIAGFLDPNIDTDQILAHDQVWAEVRAMFPAIVYHRALDDEGQIGGRLDCEAGQLFSFDLERCVELLAAADDPHDYDAIDAVGMDSTTAQLDGVITEAMDNSAITAANPQATLSIYEAGDQPSLAINAGDGRPMLIDQHETPWPDESLEDADWTAALLAALVERANQMILEAARRDLPGLAILDHTYHGNAVQLHTDQDGVTAFDSVTIEEALVTISGAFRVLCWLPEGGAVVGNGEQPEGIWATLSAPERAA